MSGGVLEMRLVVTAPDYEAALAFYRDTLGMPEICRLHVSGRAGHDPRCRSRHTRAGRPSTRGLRGRGRGRSSHRRTPAGRPAGRRYRGSHRPGARGRRRVDRPTHGNAVALAELASQRTGWTSAHPVPGVGRGRLRRHRAASACRLPVTARPPPAPGRTRESGARSSAGTSHSPARPPERGPTTGVSRRPGPRARGSRALSARPGARPAAGR